MKTVYAGGIVIDGTGAHARRADVYVEDTDIVDVRPHVEVHPGWNVVDCTGLSLSPGFIDVHSHGDNAPFLATPDTTKLLQGVTTEVVGNCGFSLAPMNASHRDDFLQIVERAFPPLALTAHSCRELWSLTDTLGYSTNYAPLVGHTAIRIAAMGWERREPTARELREMKLLLEEGLDAGAFGVSTGLIYAPGSFAATGELIELARGLRCNTLYASHIRGEGRNLLSAVDEALTVGREARVRVQISHHKAAGRENFGATHESLRRITAAREAGVDVHQDVYPYIVGATMLAAALPPQAHEGGSEALLHRLSDPQWIAQIRAAVNNGQSDFENLVAMAGYDGIVISSTGSGRYVGWSLRAIARERQLDDFDVLLDVLRSEQLKVNVVLFMMDETDVERVLVDDGTMIGSDSAPPGMGGKQHPRCFGTFARVISRYVREKRTLTLERAIHKMTGLAAATFNVPKRGVIAPGYTADVVAFSADILADDLDYQNPERIPRGIAWVLLAGQQVVCEQHVVTERKGKRLRPWSPR